MARRARREEVDPDSPEGIRSAAERSLEAQRGRPPTGISPEVGRWLALRSKAIARAVHGKDAPGKPVGNKGNTYGVGQPPTEGKKKGP